MIHPISKVDNGRDFERDVRISDRQIQSVKTGENVVEILQRSDFLFNFRHPSCYPALWRGRDVSARLSRSPASSDCAFITAMP